MSKLYKFKTAGNIVVGENSRRDIIENININEVERVVIVAQPSMKKYKYVDDIIEQFKEYDIKVLVESGIQIEPTVENIEEISNKYLQQSVDLFIGIGGGSVLDATKLLAVLKTNNCSINSILGTELIKKPGVPTVLIPSTTGTGSEVTPNAIVTLPDEELKIGIVSKYLLPELVFLDPSITVNLPKSVTAATSMDAFTHALESFISNKANPLSNMFALESMRLISEYMVESYKDGQNIKAREKMLLGSMYGGMALTSAGTAAVHAMAYPLGGTFGITHGVANSMLLPHVMRFNIDSIPHEKVNKILKVLNLKEENSGFAIIEKIEKWVEQLEIPQDLKKYHVQKKDIAALSEAASKITRLLDNNPKKVSLNDMHQIYNSLLG